MSCCDIIIGRLLGNMPLHDRKERFIVMFFVVMRLTRALWMSIRSVLTVCTRRRIFRL